MNSYLISTHSAFPYEHDSKLERCFSYSRLRPLHDSVFGEVLYERNSRRMRFQYGPGPAYDRSVDATALKYLPGRPGIDVDVLTLVRIGTKCTNRR